MRALNQARVAGDALQCSGPSSRLLQQAFSAHADPMTAPGIIAARALRQPGGRSITTLAANLTGLRKTISFGCGQAILPFVIAASLLACQRLRQRYAPRGLPPPVTAVRLIYTLFQALVCRTGRRPRPEVNSGCSKTDLPAGICQGEATEDLVVMILAMNRVGRCIVHCCPNRIWCRNQRGSG
jgi:hypothetical protein